MVGAGGRVSPWGLDVLLRFIRLRLKDEVFCRAFADDVGLILKDRRRVLPKFAQVLSDFGDISGMQVNTVKTEGARLAGEALEAVRREIVELSPARAGIPLGRSAKYLDYYIGPTTAQLQWQEAQAKILDRSHLWDWKKSGLHFASVIYLQHLLGLDCRLQAPACEPQRGHVSSGWPCDVRFRAWAKPSNKKTFGSSRTRTGCPATSAASVTFPWP